MKKILLLILGISLVLEADFTRNGNTVIDNSTGFEWQDNTTLSLMTWKDAIDYCENLELDTYIDWRLPNINELDSILDTSKSELRIDSTFQNTDSNHYWSSTTDVKYKTLAWYVNFHGTSNFTTDGFGSLNSNILSQDTVIKNRSNVSVRCVRNN